MVQPWVALYQRAPFSGGGGSPAALCPSLSSSLGSLFIDRADYLLQQQPQEALQVLAQVAGNETAGAAEFRAELAEEQAVAFMQLQQAQKAIEL